MLKTLPTMITCFIVSFKNNLFHIYLNKSQQFFWIIVSGQMRTRFTKGGVNFYRNLEDANEGEKEHLNKNRDGFYGWMGYGGSLFQWHPELKIGFAFVPSVLNIVEFCNERGAVLQQLVKDCATQ